MPGKSPDKRRTVLPGRGGQWLELLITVPATAADSLAESLVALGSPGIVEESPPPGSPGQRGPTPALSTLIAAFPLEQVGEAFLLAIRQRIDALGPETASHASLTMRLTHGRAWLERWKQFYHPFKVGRRLIIRPPWESYPPEDDEVVLILNPGLAFGTGLHATTQLCLGVLEAIAPVRPGARLLDVGCGSGILSLAALLFGFGEAHGVDLDRTAVRVARANARLNRLAERVAFVHVSLKVVPTRCEVIVANILLEPILSMLRGLHQVVAPDGALILSGILIREVDELRRGLTRHGWKVTQQATQQEWTAVICEEA
jgi:ribosomal protein L11 methyltransferase